MGYLTRVKQTPAVSRRSFVAAGTAAAAALATSGLAACSPNNVEESTPNAGGDGADENSITVFMRKIREKIEENPSQPKYVLTVWRVGYKFAERL